VNDVLNIELKTDAKGFIYAADGRPIRQLILISGHNTVSLDEFQSGIYVLSIETDTAIKSYQIVIKWNVGLPQNENRFWNIAVCRNLVKVKNYYMIQGVTKAIRF